MTSGIKVNLILEHGGAISMDGARAKPPHGVTTKLSLICVIIGFEQGLCLGLDKDIKLYCTLIILYQMWEDNLVRKPLHTLQTCTRDHNFSKPDSYLPTPA